MEKYKIACLGLWHLGEIYSAGLAELGHEVIGISEDRELISNFQKNIPPLPEPELAGLIKKNREAGRLRYSQEFGDIKECNVLWITFDTPVDDNDEVNLGVVFEAVEKAIPHLTDEVLIIATSQLPVGTSNKIKEIIRSKRPDLKFDYAYTPENLQLGEAVHCFMNPKRIVVGADGKEIFNKIRDIFYGLKAEFIEMSTPSAEVAKHAINAFLATSVSFINDIADICDVVGADVTDVARAMKSEPRIGPRAFLGAGLGFSGGTLGRDLKALLAISKTKNMSLPIISGAYAKNSSRAEVVGRRLKSELGQLKGKSVAILGLTYKPGTKTLRRSRSLEVAQELNSEGANVRLYDPAADKEEVKAKLSWANVFPNPYEATRDTQVVILMTAWPEFRNLNFGRLESLVKSPALFFDTCNFLSDKGDEIKAAGFKYLGIGRCLIHN